MRYLSLAEVLLLHHLIMEQAGQQSLVRDLGVLESAVAQPRQTFGGNDLYPELAGKAAALGFSLIQNHPFVDEAEQTILSVASGRLDRAGLQAWVEAHVG